MAKPTGHLSITPMRHCWTCLSKSLDMNLLQQQCPLLSKVFWTWLQNLFLFNHNFSLQDKICQLNIFFTPLSFLKNVLKKFQENPTSDSWSVLRLCPLSFWKYFWWKWTNSEKQLWIEVHLVVVTIFRHREETNSTNNTTLGPFVLHRCLLVTMSSKCQRHKATTSSWRRRLTQIWADEMEDLDPDGAINDSSRSFVYCN